MASQRKHEQAQQGAHRIDEPDHGGVAAQGQDVQRGIRKSHLPRKITQCKGDGKDGDVASQKAKGVAQ
jgi:hypothetical protein